MAAAATLPPTFAAGPVGQPDIAYTPNWDTYQSRVERHVKDEKRSQDLPQGFPTKLESDLVWDGQTVSDKYQWWYKLDEADIEEINHALKHFKSMFFWTRNNIEHELTHKKRPRQASR